MQFESLKPAGFELEESREKPIPVQASWWLFGEKEAKRAFCVFSWVFSLLSFLSEQFWTMQRLCTDRGYWLRWHGGDANSFSLLEYQLHEFFLFEKVSLLVALRSKNRILLWVCTRAALASRGTRMSWAGNFFHHLRRSSDYMFSLDIWLNNWFLTNG